MTIAEKILARASGLSSVQPGDYVTAGIDLAMMPSNINSAVRKYAEAGITAVPQKIWDPEKVAVIIDHRVPAYSVEIAENHKICRSFAQSLELKHFYDVFAGVCQHAGGRGGNCATDESGAGAT